MYYGLAYGGMLMMWIIGILVIITLIMVIIALGKYLMR